MQVRQFALAALVPLVLIAACSDDDNNVVGVSNAATVRFVNATGSNINVTANGTLENAASLGFGNSSSCFVVNAANPNLAFTDATTGATITGFTPTMATGSNTTVVAFTDANGNTEFTTVDNAFTPVSGDAGIRVINAAAGSGNIFVSGNGTQLSSTSVPFGSAGTFFSVPAGTQDITFNTGTGTPLLLDAGSMTFTAGQNETIVVGPALTGTSVLRSFTATGC